MNDEERIMQSTHSHTGSSSPSTVISVNSTPGVNSIINVLRVDSVRKVHLPSFSLMTKRGLAFAANLRVTQPTPTSFRKSSKFSPLTYEQKTYATLVVQNTYNTYVIPCTFESFNTTVMGHLEYQKYGFVNKSDRISKKFELDF